MRLPAPTGVEDLRTYAVARLLLDNIPHIKAYWIMLGVKTAQTALWFGADDLDGTVQEEKIYHMAGAETPQAHDPGRDRAHHPRRRAARRSSATRCTTCVAEGDALAPQKPFRRDVRREPGGGVVSDARPRQASAGGGLVPERAPDHLRPRARAWARTASTCRSICRRAAPSALARARSTWR